MSEKYFQSDVPCKKCLGVERYISNKQCVFCKKSKEKQRYESNSDRIIQKNAEWAKSNRDKTAKYKKEYADRNHDSVKQSKIVYAKKNPDKVKESKKKWNDKNPEYMSIYRSNNIEILKKKSKIYAKANSKAAVARAKKWVQDNPERAKANARRLAKQWRSTEEGKAISFMRGCVTRCVRYRNFGQRTREILGYGHLEIISHIEKQFEKWMTWENYGDKWCIDHIIPIKHFISLGITDPKIINALSNLRPLCIKENSKKSSNLDFLI